jgi:hypothetical protein
MLIQLYTLVGRRLWLPLALALIAMGLPFIVNGAQQTPLASMTLRGPDAFRTITTPAERSQALFREAGKVILHPRCVNCHPQGDRPRQGMASRLHEPPVLRGPGNHGVAAMQCNACHQTHNIDHARVPGHPAWHLAPQSMAWYGRSLAAICAQIKDPERNGGKTLAEIHEHMAHDSLVGWAWSPGAEREPAPGDQATFGALIQSWIDTGAVCPEP